jgi:predicted phage-related endonuclease
MVSTKASIQDNRRTFIGGSDARIIMGAEEAALLRLWREKRGELEPEKDLRPLLRRFRPTDAGSDMG